MDKLRLLNLQPTIFTGQVDASMKRNMSFVKRLRVVTNETLSSLDLEMQKLKLEKYLSEAVNFLLENFNRKSLDLDPLLHLVSKMHCRFGSSFSTMFNDAVFSSLSLNSSSSEKEEQNRIQKDKILIKFIAEMYFVGLFHPVALDDAGIDALIEGNVVLTDLKKKPQRKADEVFVRIYKKLLDDKNIAVLSSLFKQHSSLLLPGVVPEASASVKVRDWIYEKTKLYLKQVEKRLQQDHSRINSLQHKTEEWYFEKGHSCPEDMRQKLDSLQKTFFFVFENAKILCNYFEITLPNYEFTKIETFCHPTAMLQRPEKHVIDVGVWGDEETKNFYELIPVFELKSQVNDLKVDSLINRFPCLCSAQMVDDLARDYLSLESKFLKLRVIECLLDVKRRSDLLPYYARFMAIVKSLSDTVVSTLESNLRKQIHHHVERENAASGVEPKLVNARYLGEMVKFQLVPDAIIFFIFKMLLDKFHPQNIEIICHLIETCGMYLNYNETTKQRFTEVLDRISGFKNKITDGRLSLLVDCAILSCTPSAPYPKKERSNEELFLRYLISNLNLANVLKTSKIIGKFSEVLLRKYFTKLKCTKYHQIEPMASLLSFANNSFCNLAIHVVDNVIEEIHSALERDSFTENQKRLMYSTYLAHLFLVNLVDNTTMIEILFLILKFPSNDFKIRIILSILDLSFEKLSLNEFMPLFQNEIASLNLSSDVEFLVVDFFEKHNLKRIPKIIISTPIKPKIPEIEISEEDIDRDLQELMKQSSDSKKRHKNLPVPLRTYGFSRSSKMSLLTMRGSFSVSHEIQLTENDSFLSKHVENVLLNDAIKRKELKSLVLTYERMDQEENTKRKV